MTFSDETFFISYQSLCIHKKWTSLYIYIWFLWHKLQYGVSAPLWDMWKWYCILWSIWWLTSKHTVNMTNCRNFALKETDLCKICFVYMCKFTWGYGLYRATDKLNWSVQLLIWTLFSRPSKLLYCSII